MGRADASPDTPPTALRGPGERDRLEREFGGLGGASADETPMHAHANATAKARQNARAPRKTRVAGIEEAGALIDV